MTDKADYRIRSIFTFRARKFRRTVSVNLGIASRSIHIFEVEILNIFFFDHKIGQEREKKNFNVLFHELSEEPPELIDKYSFLNIEGEENIFIVTLKTDAINELWNYIGSCEFSLHFTIIDGEKKFPIVGAGWTFPTSGPEGLDPVVLELQLMRKEMTSFVMSFISLIKYSIRAALLLMGAVALCQAIFGVFY